ncbi:MAG TPA: ATP synthase F1 subunit delta [Patescibacteria group bacterium]|nr:ATP synthase F1 subunit delta [Patescibacteria group bacterium]
MKFARKKHFVKSLVELGKQENCLEQILLDLEDVDKKIDQNIEFKSFLNNKQVDIEKKKQALKSVFSDFISLKTYNFLYLLIKNNKLNYLSEILEQAEELNREYESVELAEVESAFKLSQDQEVEIKAILEDKIKKQVIIRNKVNPEIIAGLNIKIKDTVIESSILSRIKRLEEKIKKF